MRMALRDDLLRAASLITASGDPTYARGFLRSLARAAGDTALEEAVEGPVSALDHARLVRLIGDRLAALDPLT